MKKMFLGILLILSALSAHAQFGVVSAPILESLTQATHIDQVIYYIQMVEQQMQAAANTYNQLQNMIRAEQRALDNLKGITQVSDFGDFMDWYNRQLYLERQTEQRFTNMGIKIGKKTYKVADIDQIPDAAGSRYGSEYWANEFTDEQRRAMWLNLGMTPANYAYVQTWKAKEDEIGRILLTNREIQNEEYQEAMLRNRELSDMVLNGDVGEKGVLQAIFEVLVDTNKASREGNMQYAMALEYQEARDKQGEAPANDPVISDWWGQSMFRPIDN
ncbi:MAG: hypothetical protein LBK40_06210 [Spirochaetaceae bacterium]|jgi:hypothetical protein|nr:hypothetical protein [Spirochaetaceae bacterium]